MRNAIEVFFRYNSFNIMRHASIMAAKLVNPYKGLLNKGLVVKV
jgi:hypothetical protein